MPLAFILLMLTSQLTMTTADQLAGVQCEDDAVGYIVPDPTYCNRYLDCDPVQGRSIQLCPPGLSVDLQTGTCEEEAKVDCGRRKMRKQQEKKSAFEVLVKKILSRGAPSQVSDHRFSTSTKAAFVKPSLSLFGSSRRQNILGSSRQPILADSVEDEIRQSNTEVVTVASQPSAARSLFRRPSTRQNVLGTIRQNILGSSRTHSPEPAAPEIYKEVMPTISSPSFRRQNSLGHPSLTTTSSHSRSILSKAKSILQDIEEEQMIVADALTLHEDAEDDPLDNAKCDGTEEFVVPDPTYCDRYVSCPGKVKELCRKGMVLDLNTGYCQREDTTDCTGRQLLYRKVMKEKSKLTKVRKTRPIVPSKQLEGSKRLSSLSVHSSPIKKTTSTSPPPSPSGIVVQSKEVEGSKPMSTFSFHPINPVFKKITKSLPSTSSSSFPVIRKMTTSAPSSSHLHFPTIKKSTKHTSPEIISPPLEEITTSAPSSSRLHFPTIKKSTTHLNFDNVHRTSTEEIATSALSSSFPTIKKSPTHLNPNLDKVHHTSAEVVSSPLEEEKLIVIDSAVLQAIYEEPLDLPGKKKEVTNLLDDEEEAADPLDDVKCEGRAEYVVADPIYCDRFVLCPEKKVELCKKGMVLDLNTGYCQRKDSTDCKGRELLHREVEEEVESKLMEKIKKIEQESERVMKEVTKKVKFPKIMLSKKGSSDANNPGRLIVEPIHIASTRIKKNTMLSSSTEATPILRITLTTPSPSSTDLQLQHEVPTTTITPILKVSTESSPPSSADPLDDLSCEQSEDGYIVPDPEQCDRFAECSPHGEKFYKLCPDGLVLSLSKGLCDYPEKVDCQDRPRLQSSLGKGHCIRENGNFALPAEVSCTQYVDCRGGEGNLQSCGAGAVFDEVLGCVHPDETTRTGCTAIDKYEFQCPTFGLSKNFGDHDRLAHPIDCKLFYACLRNGLPRLLGCEKPTVFNPETGVCDKQENVPGCEEYYVVDKVDHEDRDKIVQEIREQLLKEFGLDRLG
eukprot:GFUD01021765.1.p1 GENE.GFUD01021765.1~~GFUD01021765.1.p1  ORF type:complete len:1012 (+),score=236.64 GFUD01021765.1:51-3086(+)